MDSAQLLRLNSLGKGRFNWEWESHLHLHRQVKSRQQWTLAGAKASRFLRSIPYKEAKKTTIMWSVHLKATMWKVSQPNRIWPRCAQFFYKRRFEKYSELFKEIGVNPNQTVLTASVLPIRSKHYQNETKKKSTKPPACYEYSSRISHGLIPDKGIT